MKFCWSTLEVINMEESLKFYTEIIGLDVMTRFDTDNGLSIAFLGKGDTKIELICSNTNKIINIGEDISWGFEVPSLDIALSLVAEKHLEIIDGPHQPTPKTKYFFILDPNGLKIQFVENM